METLERLLVTIEGSSELLRQELRKGGSSVDQFAKQTENRVAGMQMSWSKLSSTLRTALGAFGVGFGVASIVNFTRNAIQAADAIGETAKAAGFGAERFQRLSFVFRQNGVSAQEFDGAMRTLNTRLGQFITTGAGPAAKALEELGLKSRVLSGEISTSEQLFDAVVKALEGVDNAAQRAALSAAFFGREIGSKMAPTMQQGAEAMNAAADAATGVFTDETVRKADELANAMDRLGASTWNWAKGLAIAATHSAGQGLGMQVGLETERDRLLERQRLLQAFGGRELSEEESTRLRDLERQITRAAAVRKLEGMNAGGARSGLRADGRTSFDTSGFSDMTVAARRVGSAQEMMNPFLSELRRQIAQDKRMAGLEEVKVGAVTTPRFSPGLQEAIKALDRYKERLEETAKQQQALFQTLGNAVQSSLANAFRGVSTNFSDLMKDLASQLAASAFMKGLFTLLGGPAAVAAGGFKGFAAGVFGGSRANEGPVSAGKVYKVHEGEAFFAPGMDGDVRHFAGAGAGGNVVINQYNTYNGGNREERAAMAAEIAKNNQRLKAEIRHEQGRRR